MNERLAVQQGCFIMQGGPLTPNGFSNKFSDHMARYGAHELKQHVTKIQISATARADASADLDFMNINRASLFPGLDGFAQSLKPALDVSRRVRRA
jgi:hypothetical protein